MHLNYRHSTSAQQMGPPGIKHPARTRSCHQWGTGTCGRAGGSRTKHGHVAVHTTGGSCLKASQSMLGRQAPGRILKHAQLPSPTTDLPTAQEHLTLPPLDLPSALLCACTARHICDGGAQHENNGPILWPRNHHQLRPSFNDTNNISASCTALL